MKLLKQKTLFILMIMVFFVLTEKTEARVVINEVQISPIADRFVELYNEGGSDVDLTGWYLQRRTATGTTYSSMVTSTSFEGKIIKAGSYFLISKSSLDNTDIIAEGMTLTDGNSIRLKKNEKEVVYEIGIGNSSICGDICVPSPAENKSSQRTVGGDWVVSVPTPGKVNSSLLEENTDNENDEESSEDNNSSSSSDSGSKKKEIILNPKIMTKIISKKVVVAGIPFEINHETIGYKNEKKILGRFVWNFGDGMVKEEEYSPPFYYIYQYPGDYALSLSFYDTHFSVIPESTDRINIKVIPSGINILSVGTVSDPYIELENNSTHEMILNKWIIKGAVRSFEIPERTIILPNKKIKLSPKITGFDFGDLMSLVITDDKGTVFAVYPKQKVYSSKVSSVSYSSKNVSTSSTREEININKEADLSGKGVINLNNLEASAGGSDSKVPKSVYSWIGLVVIIVLGMVGILSIQNKNKEMKDYTDDEIRAEDMTIME